MELAGVFAVVPVLTRLAQSDIWLLHLTGEEFPGDDLGARHFLQNALANKQDFRGLVLMDMIGWRNQTIDDRVFQVNAGDSPASLSIASIALNVASDVAP